MDRYGKIEGMEDIVDLIDELGFLPFFRNPIEGWSLEEKTPAEFWFNDDNDGVWADYFPDGMRVWEVLPRESGFYIARLVPGFPELPEVPPSPDRGRKVHPGDTEGRGFTPLERTQGLHGIHPGENESD